MDALCKTSVCNPSPSYSITMRVEIENRIGMFARIATAISGVGGDMGAVDIVGVEKGKIIRDITVNARDEGHEQAIVKAITAVPGVKVLRSTDRTFTAHEGGKIEIKNKLPVRDRNDLSKVYTPGVARVCMDIHRNREHAYRYTMKGNSVAVVSDGTAVLGLGDIGPEAALPVMEGKAMIFKEFASINAFPIVLATKNVDEIVETVKNIAPAFGGINLEDFSAPHCFEVETRLRKLLDIPVFHDDQHGTAVVVLAALINVARLLQARPQEVQDRRGRRGRRGHGRNYKMLLSAGVKDIIVCDRTGVAVRRQKAGHGPGQARAGEAYQPAKTEGEHSRRHEGGARLHRGVGAERDHRRTTSGGWPKTLSSSPLPIPIPRSRRRWPCRSSGSWRRAGRTTRTRSTTCSVSPACSGGCST